MAHKRSRDSRAGEALWYEWDGDGYEAARGRDESIVFFTLGHVDIENEVVRRALASALQREGIVAGLGHGYRALEGVEAVHDYVGIVGGDTYFTVCDALGVTRYGDDVDVAREATWVELPV